MTVVPRNVLLPASVQVPAPDLVMFVAAVEPLLPVPSTLCPANTLSTPTLSRLPTSQVFAAAVLPPLKPFRVPASPSTEPRACVAEDPEAIVPVPVKIQ